MNVYKLYVLWRGYWAWDNTQSTYWLRQFDYDAVRAVLYALSRVSGGTMLEAALFENPLSAISEPIDVSEFYRRATAGVASCIGWALMQGDRRRVFIPYADGSLPLSPTSALPYVWKRYSDIFERYLVTLDRGVYEPLQISHIVIRVRRASQYINKMRRGMT